MTREELNLAKQSMEQYVLYARIHGQTPRRKAYFQGAAAAINDLLCRLGHGDEADALMATLQEFCDDTEMFSSQD